MRASSLSDLKNRSDNSTGRGQISSILKGNSSSIAQESGGIWNVQADLQPISVKPDRLLAVFDRSTVPLFPVLSGRHADFSALGDLFSVRTRPTRHFEVAEPFDHAILTVAARF